MICNTRPRRCLQILLLHHQGLISWIERYSTLNQEVHNERRYCGGVTAPDLQVGRLRALQVLCGNKHLYEATRSGTGITVLVEQRTRRASAMQRPELSHATLSKHQM